VSTDLRQAVLLTGDQRRLVVLLLEAQRRQIRGDIDAIAGTADVPKEIRDGLAVQMETAETILRELGVEPQTILLEEIVQPKRLT
jgi:hypothetical protein